MSDTVTAKNGVTSQYLTRVTGDLEQNLKEQERLGTEIALLQSQLADLEEDRAVLLSLQEALGTTSTPTSPTAGPAPTTTTAANEDAAAPAKAKKSRAKKSAATKSAAAPRKTTGKRETAPAKLAEPRQPSLVSLARAFLTSQTEPRSAAEIAEALAQQHPDRDIKTTVVRTTLEGLVAKNHAQRNKQGSSVFYTAPDPAETPAATNTSPEQAI